MCCFHKVQGRRVSERLESDSKGWLGKSWDLRLPKCENDPWM